MGTDVNSTSNPHSLNIISLKRGGSNIDSNQCVPSGPCLKPLYPEPCLLVFYDLILACRCIWPSYLHPDHAQPSLSIPFSLGTCFILQFIYLLFRHCTVPGIFLLLSQSAQHISQLRCQQVVLIARPAAFFYALISEHKCLSLEYLCGSVVKPADILCSAVHANLLQRREGDIVRREKLMSKWFN